jgi:ABC-2 type transport system ATP-binding protein
MSILTVKNLTKAFGDKDPFIAVNGISFEMKQGEILGILGPNGAGKTTTLQMLLGILTPTSGTIEYFGKDLDKFHSEALEKISFASTYVSLPYNLTVEQNLLVIGRLYGFKKKTIQKNMDEYLEKLGILNKKKSLVTTLSAGQTTRMMLAKALMTKPKLLLLDEPTASLDPEIAQEVVDLILQIRKEEGVSILLTSHNMNEVSTLCDRLIFLQSGKIIANDKPSKLAKSMLGIKLLIDFGIHRELADTFLKNRSYKHIFSGHICEIELPDESHISKVLQELAEAKISYQHLNIKTPNLEDYFLAQVNKKG